MVQGLGLGLPYAAQQRASGGAPVVTANAQLVLNKAKKTGFTYFIRML